MKDFYTAMENFAKKDRKSTQICTSQLLVADGKVVEIWHDQKDGSNIKVTYNVDGTYLIKNHTN